MASKKQRLDERRAVARLSRSVKINARWPPYGAFCSDCVVTLVPPKPALLRAGHFPATGPCGLTCIFENGGHNYVRFVVRRFTCTEHCRRVPPWFVVEIAIADIQVDVHSLGPPLLAKCCRLSGKVCICHVYGFFGLVRADLDEPIRVTPPCSSRSSHRVWNRIGRTCVLLVQIEPRKPREIGGLRGGRRAV